MLWTNRGKFRTLNILLRDGTEPTVFYLFLATAAVTPTVDINTKSELTEIATGNGYTAGGTSLSRNATDFDVMTEDDTNDRAFAQIRDVVYTASGGNLPASGAGASYAVFTDDNVTVGSRDVITVFDLVSPRTVSDTQTLTLQNCEFRLN
jgi:hypothetical protein